MSEYYKAVVPKGAHLAPAKGYSNAYRGALLDNKKNQLSGQAIFVPMEKENSQTNQEVLIAIIRAVEEIIKANPELVSIIMAGIGQAVRTGVKKVRYWIKEKIEQSRSQKRLEISSAQRVEIAAASALTPKVLANDETQKRLSNIVMLAAQLADELNKYAVACYQEGIDVPDNVLEWLIAVEKLAAQETIDNASTISERDLTCVEETLTKATAVLESTARLTAVAYP
ncbi:MAG: hypothetical protein LBB75_08030 [Oscillospiraceae bacterium]|nr:hypothetical protein [Oscillospiraceae bacterium]